jgi:hypothetical protein
LDFGDLKVRIAQAMQEVVTEKLIKRYAEETAKHLERSLEAVAVWVNNDEALRQWALREISQAIKSKMDLLMEANGCTPDRLAMVRAIMRGGIGAPTNEDLTRP